MPGVFAVSVSLPYICNSFECTKVVLKPPLALLATCFSYNSFSTFALHFQMNDWRCMTLTVLMRRNTKQIQTKILTYQGLHGKSSTSGDAVLISRGHSALSNHCLRTIVRLFFGYDASFVTRNLIGLNRFRGCGCQACSDFTFLETLIDWTAGVIVNKL